MSVSVDAPVVGHGASRQMLERFLVRPEAPSLVFLLLLIGLSLTAEGFMTAANFEQILDQVAIIGILALGVNLVVLGGEIDISVGSVLALCAVAAGTVAVDHGGFVLPLVTALAIGAAVGALNGLLVTVGRIPSIIVTLGMLYAIRGFVLAASDTGVTEIPDAARSLGQGSVMGIGVTVIMLAAVFVAMAFIARHSTWGRNAFAVGGNRRAARLAGVPVDHVRFAGFVVVGLCSGLAAMIYMGQLGLVQPQAATGLELQVIAAVVIGGTSITGGRGSVAAALVGAVLIGVILNGTNLLGIQERWQDVFTGALILLAVTADVARRRILTRMQAR